MLLSQGRRMRILSRVAGVFLLAMAIGVALGGQRDLTHPAILGLPTTEEFISGVDGARLFCRIVGTGGNSIVFVHGGPGLGIEDGGLDLEQIAANGFRFIECDERGGGRSALVPREKLGLEYYVRDVEAIRRHFRLQRMNLIGLSWGTPIVARYAADYRRNVAKVVFLSPMPPTEEFDQQRTAHWQSLMTKAELELETALGQRILTAPDSEVAALCRKFYAVDDRLYVADVEHLRRARGDFCSYSPSAIRAGVENADLVIALLGHWNWRSLLAEVKAPALVIEGEKSNVPLEQARAWAEWLPHAKLLLVPGAGHMNWLDDLETVTRSISDFLRGQN
jgi:proline iminopeptidase